MNIRLSSWVTLIVFNPVLGILAADALTNPELADKPLARFGFGAVCTLMFVISMFLTIRGVRIAVWINGDRIHVRNYTRSYSISLDDATGFSYGYAEARMPLYDQAGSLTLKNGDVRPVVAISRGMIGSSDPDPQKGGLLEDLNAVVAAYQSK